MVKKILGMDAGNVNLGEPIIIPANQYFGNYIASENGTSYFSHNSGGLKITPEEAEIIRRIELIWIKKLEQQFKETERKIISLYSFIVKHNKQSPVMIKDNILKRFEKEFPEYFKESD